MIETIKGHRYEVTRDPQGVIIKLEGRDLPVPIVDPEKDAALVIANKTTKLTPEETGQLMQFLVKRLT